MVLSSSESAIRHQVNGLFQKFYIKSNIVLESKSIITATELALKGLGLTITSASILKRIKQSPINLLPIDKSLIYIDFFIATKSKGNVSPSIIELIKEFQQIDFNSTIEPKKGEGHCLLLCFTPAVRLELTTSWLTVKRSTNWAKPEY